MRELYPEIPAHEVFDLDVEGGHTLRVSRYGQRGGKPAVFLHGGPGGGAKGKDARYFDPDLYDIVLFDQRGCGDSRPFASLEANDTFRLVADIEAIRSYLGIDRWLVFGGSWGSTLALTYAISHPERVTELVLRGIFLGTQREIAHLYQDGASRFFPEAYAAFLEPIPPADRPDLVRAYYSRLTDADPEIRLAAARAWSTWEASILRLLPDVETIRDMGADKFAEPFARIECHYFINDCFFDEDDWILRRVDRLAAIPATIIHGRYDVVCAPEAAWRLHRAWPESRLEMVPDAGHSSSEPGIVHALVTATDRYARESGSVPSS